MKTEQQLHGRLDRTTMEGQFARMNVNFKVIKHTFAWEDCRYSFVRMPYASDCAIFFL